MQISTNGRKGKEMKSNGVNRCTAIKSRVPRDERKEEKIVISFISYARIYYLHYYVVLMAFIIKCFTDDSQL